MCGIFGFLGEGVDVSTLINALSNIKHRGPDNTRTLTIDNMFFGFHRLAIMGLDSVSDQPMTIDNITLCCNGEIYNYRELAEQYGFSMKSHSDCEIIIHLYSKFGIEKTCQLLDGEFSFILYDASKKELFAGRDHLGLRGFFYGTVLSSDRSELKTEAFASEAKALDFCDEVKPFPPRSWWSHKTGEFTIYYEFVPRPIERTIEEHCKLIKEVFIHSVKRRVQMSDRPVGFLLSGGLDSSLCVGLAMKCFKNPKNVHSFSIGLKGSPDLKYAKMVADFLGTSHHAIEYSEEDFLKEIPETIRLIESYDVTTVRASTWHRLVSKYIRENTDIKVVISGEVSDELTCGYMIFGNLKPEDVEEESLRLLNEIHLYDTLRSDRSVSGNGLEGRYPFAAKELVELYLSIPSELKTFDKSHIEKYLLRKAFADQGLLPHCVLWRKKDGFSDAVSDIDRPTRVIIKEFIDTQISDEEYEKEREKYNHLKPETKEELYYREIFEIHYPGRSSLISRHWRPNPKFYGTVIEPSGRILSTFS